MTFGVVPDCPHTEYGNIETEGVDKLGLKVRRFVEKPSLTLAEQFLDSGNFYWKAGIFLFKASTMLDLLRLHGPAMLSGCEQSLAGATVDLGFNVLSEGLCRRARHLTRLCESREGE